ncbi:hypothetical protein V6N11_061069 [Hibiscus sabdariffa]|uniref:Cytochrome P450 n=1 Tax=Hibiscus sabdariffa TaxID=183260 RepID=A0ABR2QS49_9ROSI
MKIVKRREDEVVNGEADSFGRDFLGLLVHAYRDLGEKNRLSLEDLVDECKTFYLAGQETVNSLLAWTILLLAIHGHWQEKERREVIQIFGNQNPHVEGIAKLKTRFTEGIARATKYNSAAYFPFGLGPRSCVGMTFATTETKIVLSMILQRYTITLSPAYVHSPMTIITLQPQHGIQITLESLHNDA